MDINLQKQLSDNSMTLTNLFDLEQNMRSLLEEDATLCYKNCQDMKINIDSKINKISFESCNNIEISLNGLVTGIYINSCDNIKVNNKKKQPLNEFNIVESNCIKVLTSKEVHQHTTYNIDNSYGIIVQDHTKTPLKVKR